MLQVNPIPWLDQQVVLTAPRVNIKPLKIPTKFAKTARLEITVPLSNPFYVIIVVGNRFGTIILVVRIQGGAMYALKAGYNEIHSCK